MSELSATGASSDSKQLVRELLRYDKAKRLPSARALQSRFFTSGAPEVAVNPPDSFARVRTAEGLARSRDEAKAVSTKFGPSFRSGPSGGHGLGGLGLGRNAFDVPVASGPGMAASSSSPNFGPGSSLSQPKGGYMGGNGMVSSSSSSQVMGFRDSPSSAFSSSSGFNSGGGFGGNVGFGGGGSAFGGNFGFGGGAVHSSAGFGGGTSFGSTPSFPSASSLDTSAGIKRQSDKMKPSLANRQAFQAAAQANRQRGPRDLTQPVALNAGLPLPPRDFNRPFPEMDGRPQEPSSFQVSHSSSQPSHPVIRSRMPSWLEPDSAPAPAAAPMASSGSKEIPPRNPRRGLHDGDLFGDAPGNDEELADLFWNQVENSRRPDR